MKSSRCIKTYTQMTQEKNNFDIDIHVKHETLTSHIQNISNLFSDLEQQCTLENIQRTSGSFSTTLNF